MPDRTHIAEPGIYFDVPIADYHLDPCPLPSLTQSIAKILLEQSPAHARLAHPRLAPPLAADEEEEVEKYVAAQAIGEAAHAALIGRGKLIFEAGFDSWRSKDAKAMRADALGAGKIAILTHHADRARAMVKAASFQLEAAGHRDAFRAGKGEVVLAWQEGNIWFRTLIDWMAERWPKYYDYKSTGLSCAPHVVVDRPGELGWDIQAAMHERGLDVLDPDNAGRREFYFINQENEPPYALTPIRISRADLTLGHKKLQTAVDIWTECMASGQWPGYPAETVMSQPRPWTEAKWLGREIERDERRTRRREPMLTDLSGG